LLYLDGDPWLDDDTIFSVKPDLIVALERHERPEEPRAHGVDRPFSTATYDFTLELAG
jgi:hydroxyquinol 1,2-dioxygenase